MVLFIQFEILVLGVINVHQKPKGFCIVGFWILRPLFSQSFCNTTQLERKEERRFQVLMCRWWWRPKSPTGLLGPWGKRAPWCCWADLEGSSPTPGLCSHPCGSVLYTFLLFTSDVTKVERKRCDLSLSSCSNSSRSALPGTAREYESTGQTSCRTSRGTMLPLQEGGSDCGDASVWLASLGGRPLLLKPYVARLPLPDVLGTEETL